MSLCESSEPLADVGLISPTVRIRAASSNEAEIRFFECDENNLLNYNFANTRYEYFHKTRVPSTSKTRTKSEFYLGFCYSGANLIYQPMNFVLKFP